ncbi:MAG: undecaprenyl/decaprenyl-phosphate alpha-N-acetylglucosaminyl 1-phosphate transferase [Acidimicrobiia bacterium]|nr:undecaprenyl/decaprenyl-phosphate alpha-N-acetylglucosaminyl 1-phosphate transferase [Acidimicrobiia bacterium]
MEGALAFAAALAVALAATPVVARLALATGLVDHPGPLKVHRAPVAYLGGLAVAVAVAGPIGAHRPALLAPLAAALALGVADDALDVPPRLRLACEAGIGVLAGVVVPAPGMPTAQGIALTAVIAVGLVNAVNLLDGLDGLAAGAALASALGFAALGAGARVPALALAGALVGFLAYNRPPARIYLGDGGAYLLGTALALCCVLALDGGGASAWLGAPLIVAVPAVDTAIAIARRFRARLPLFGGDRSHVYDQLVDRGWTAPAAVLALVALQGALAVAGVAAGRLSAVVAGAITSVCAIAIVAATVLGGFLSPTTSAPEGSE